MTRLDNTLDLFLTNRPSLINRCTPIPGIADHDIVFIELPISATRNKPTKRKIHLWKHANISQLKEDILNFVKEFSSKFNCQSNIESMWKDITTYLSTIMEKHVPSKMTSTRFNQTWITCEIKQLSRQKKKSFKKARASQSPKHSKRYQQLKKKTQKACKTAYNDYVANIYHQSQHQTRRNSGALSPVKGKKVAEFHL